MKRIFDPKCLDMLASAYALGTLRGGARRRLEALAREHPQIRAAVLIWQSRLAALTELHEPVQPPPAVWRRIERALRADLESRQTARQAAVFGGVRRAWWSSLTLWRGATVTALLAAIVVGVALMDTRISLQMRQAELAALRQSPPTTRYVAVLNDAQDRAEILVTYEPDYQRLTLQRVGNYREAADRSLQLWALPPGQPPRSLGVMGAEPLLRLARREAEVIDAPTLAISLEPRGGVAGERGPTGPVLFTGALIRQQL